MSVTLLQFDFPFAGPWAGAMTAQLEGLAKDIAAEDGLIWKIWTENESQQRAGGIYLFANAAAAERYRRKHEARLAAFGIGGIVAHAFAVNAPLSAVTRAPV
jgi:hypothetical protein